MNQKRRRSGQSLIEFALLFPLVILLIAGFFDLGRAVFYFSSLTNAVREGARFAIVNREAIAKYENNLEDNPIKQEVISYAFGLINTPDPLTADTIEIELIDETISIKAWYVFKPVTPGLARLLGNSTGIKLVAKSVMRISGASR